MIKKDIFSCKNLDQTTQVKKNLESSNQGETVNNMKKLINSKIKLFSIFIALVGILYLIKSGVIKYTPTEDKSQSFHSLFMKDGKSFYTLDQANKIAMELIPVIEKVAGKKFKKNPVIKLLDGKEIKNILIREADIKMLNNSNKLIEERNKILPHITSMYFGLYGSRDQTVYLLPKRIEPICKILNLDKEYGIKIVKVLIAHELTHALQDQYLNLWDQRNNLPGKEELDAYSAAIEGHAVFVAKEVGRQIGLKADIINLFPLVKSIKQKFHTQHRIQQMKAFQSPLKNIYSLGEIFINYHHSKEGNKLIWQILSNPPVNVTMILNPELYSSQPYSYVNYKHILENLYNYQDHYKNHQFIYKNHSSSQLDLRLSFRNVDIPQKEILLSKIKHYQSLLIYSHEILLAQISFIVLENSQYASQYVLLREKFISGLFSNLKNVIKREPWENIEIRSNCINSIDLSRRATITLTVKDSNMKDVRKTNIQSIIQKNNIILTHNDDTFDLDPCTVGKIASKIFTRYKNAKKKND
jgi:hypothetical protein